MSSEHASQWQQVEVAGKVCDVFEPSKASPFALIFLHGVGMETLVSNGVWTRLLEVHGLRAICPHGKRCWWTNRVCNEFDPQLTAERFVVQHLLADLHQRWGAEPPGIGLTGISMGGQGALRLAFKYASKFPVVAAISAALDFQMLHGQGTPIDDMYSDSESARQDTAILQVHPLNWPRNMMFVIDPQDRFWWDGNVRLHEKLAALGIPHQYDVTTSAGGHSWEYFDYMAPRVVEFIVKGLQSELQRKIGLEY